MEHLPCEFCHYSLNHMMLGLLWWCENGIGLCDVLSCSIDAKKLLKCVMHIWHSDFEVCKNHYLLSTNVHILLDVPLLILFFNRFSPLTHNSRYFKFFDCVLCQQITATGQILAVALCAYAFNTLICWTNICHYFRSPEMVWFWVLSFWNTSSTHVSITPQQSCLHLKSVFISLAVS